jgi:hypothetical protein
MENKILYWQIAGMVFILFVGSFMHFLFELTGNWPPIGAIAAVNESIWEHLKLGYWPLVFFALIEYKFIKEEVNNSFLAKFISALSIIVIIPVFFYSYTAILGEHMLLLDMISFILAIIVGQLLSYKILTKSAYSELTSLLSLIGLIAIGVVFVLFTYLPPHLPLFQDSLTGLYGIPY